MARQPRIEYPGAVYHVISRGNDGQNVFVDDRDKYAFLAVLRKTVRHHNVILHSYCLMDNHYHLMLETPDGNLSTAMKVLNGSYTQKFNWLHKRHGHVFQGRYKAILVEKDNYLLELCRYLALNPVRAGIVGDPAEYRWSSFKFAIGRAAAPDFLDPSWILSCFSNNMDAAMARYKEFVLQAMGKEAVLPGNSLVVGSEGYIREITNMAEEAGSNRRPSARLLDRPSLEQLFASSKSKRDRNKTIYCAYVDYAYRQNEIAHFLGISYSTVNRAVSLAKMTKVST